MRDIVKRTEEPVIVIEGIEEVIKKDLGTHKIILERLQNELLAFRSAVSTEVQKKRNWAKLIGKGKYNDASLRASIQAINVNIRHMQDKVKATTDRIEFETNIVDTLTEQLDNQYKKLKILAEHNKKEK